MHQHDFSIDTDHFQFYLEDCQHSDAEYNLWLHAFIPEILDVYDGGLAIGTARWGLQTRVSVVILEEAPDDASLSDWDRVVEASVECRSGCICIASPESGSHEETRMKIAPGWYRVRICWGNIQSVDDELEPTGEDQYVLFLWTASYALPSIIQKTVESA